MKWDDVVKLHKKKYGYQIQPQTLGVKDIIQALDMLPYIEVCTSYKQKGQSGKPSYVYIPSP